jgi:hypothetical protein
MMWDSATNNAQRSSRQMGGIHGRYGQRARACSGRSIRSAGREHRLGPSIAGLVPGATFHDRLRESGSAGGVADGVAVADPWPHRAGVGLCPVRAGSGLLTSRPSSTDWGRYRAARHVECADALLLRARDRHESNCRRSRLQTVRMLNVGSGPAISLRPLTSPRSLPIQCAIRSAAWVSRTSAPARASVLARWRRSAS